ncbi:MAG: T9SS type A sorting domain-containing protein [Flavobacteriales bacterium]|nr:T9SS type A sorting domain-containing protein [Flavobacteriales bacterium]
MRRWIDIAAYALACSAQAQLFTMNMVPVSLTGGVAMTVEGSVLLQNTATFNNDGQLRVTGDWTNDSGNSGIASPSTGSVLLYGATSQFIQGAQVTDFRNLVISGGNKVLLQDAVAGLPSDLSGTLALNGAVIVLNGRTFSLFNPAAIALIDGGGTVRSETTDLLSRFQWALGADLNAHYIPFSTATGAAIPFAFTPSSPYPLGTLMGVATYPTAPDNTPYAVTALQQVDHMAGVSLPDNSDNTADRFWLVDLPNGSSAGTLHLSHTPQEDPILGPGPIRAQRWLENAGTWEPPLPGQSNPALREVVVPTVPFSEGINPQNEHIWVLAYDFAPLPISLLFFDATAMDNKFVRCTWVTLSEQDNDFFSVERSRDGTSFEEVGQVQSAGNSISPLHYAFDDNSPYRGLSYYRLRQTDYDGSSTLSQMVPVWLDEQDPVIAVFPNPNNGTFTIARGDAEEELHFELLDASGRLIRHWLMPQGVERESVTLTEASGLYTLRWNGRQLRVSVGR